MKLWLDVYLRRNEHGDAWESTAEADGRQISKRLLQNLREVGAVKRHRYMGLWDQAEGRLVDDLLKACMQNIYLLTCLQCRWLICENLRSCPPSHPSVITHPVAPAPARVWRPP